jgi:acetyl-CoA carboxylase carboxyl transferase subunit alpha
LMFEHAVYSVISPEGCASILWRTNDKAADAAQAMKMTAADLKALGVIDGIVPEPVGGAHRDPVLAIANLGKAIGDNLKELENLSRSEIKSRRHAKFLAIGQ